MKINVLPKENQASKGSFSKKAKQFIALILAGFLILLATKEMVSYQRYSQIESNLTLLDNKLNAILKQNEYNQALLEDKVEKVTLFDKQVFESLGAKNLIEMKVDESKTTAPFGIKVFTDNEYLYVKTHLNIITPMMIESVKFGSTGMIYAKLPKSKLISFENNTFIAF